MTAQYSFKSNSKADGTEGRSSADRYAGAAVNYENGNFQAVLGYEFIDRSSLDSAPITKDGQLVTLGGNYNFEGVAQVFAMGQYFRGWDEVAGQNYEDLGLTGKGLKGWGAHLGTIVPVAGGDLTAGLYYVDGETGDSAVIRRALTFSTTVSLSVTSTRFPSVRLSTPALPMASPRSRMLLRSTTRRPRRLPFTPVCRSSSNSVFLTYS